MLRVPSSTVLRTAEEYVERSGELVQAPEHAHRTHAEDDDPVVATFDNLISAEEARVRAQPAGHPRRSPRSPRREVPER